MQFKQLILQVVLAAALPVMQSVAADRCLGTAPEAEAWVAGKLDEANSARDSGDFDRSGALLQAAATGFPRIADVSIPARCMGNRNWRRYYQEKQLTYRELGRRAERSGSKFNREREGLSYYINGDNRSDVERVLNDLPDDPVRYAGAGNAIRGALSEYQWAIDNGFMLLSEEQAGQRFYRDRLDRLITHSRTRGTALLRSEVDIINSGTSEEEMLIESTGNNAVAMIGAMTGDESIMPVNEARQDVNRARKSLTKLREAKQWLEWISANESIPVLERSVKRGEILNELGGNTSLGLEARDDYYGAAIRYFELADADIKSASARSSREAIEPALKAERAEREAKIDEKAAEMQESIQDFQQSIEKTDREKEKFKSEADSLEAELGF